MKVTVCYFAMLREKAGTSEEAVETTATTAQELFEELRVRHDFPCGSESLKVAVDQEMTDWSTPLQAGQTISFIPPVSGG